MTVRRISLALVGATAILLAVALVLIGRATVDTHKARDAGYQKGRDAGYFDGLRAGEAQGRQEGRALQEGQSLPAGSRQPVQDAFNAGYVAGANDVFSGYDGGWALTTPYVVTLEQGSGHIVYRVSSRDPLQPGLDYYLCPNGHELCQQPHHR